MSEAKHVYELYIRTTPERLWEAITSPEFTQGYFDSAVKSDWKAGSPYMYTNNEGGKNHYGTLLEVDPPRRLVQTFEHDYTEQYGGGPEEVSQVTWEIAKQDEVCKLTLVHTHPSGDSKSFESTGAGWPLVLSSLKTQLETGVPLPASPQMEAQATSGR